MRGALQADQIVENEGNSMKPDGERKSPQTSDVVTSGMSEAEIDENLKGTFPASDPPAWTLGSDHRSEAGQKPDEGGSKEGSEGSRAPS
jgi:hypothetical protein